MTIKWVFIGIATLAVAGLVAMSFKAAYDEGRAVERAETLKRAVELVKQRDKIDASLKKATPVDICARLGGRTVNGECE